MKKYEVKIKIGGYWLSSIEVAESEYEAVLEFADNIKADFDICWEDDKYEILSVKEVSDDSEV